MGAKGRGVKASGLLVTDHMKLLKPWNLPDFPWAVPKATWDP